MFNNFPVENYKYTNGHLVILRANTVYKRSRKKFCAKSVVSPSDNSGVYNIS